MVYQEAGKFVWHNGKVIPWEEATIHVMTHVVHYGSSVFEGIRCYETKRGSAIFRLNEHIERLLNSGYIYRMKVPYSKAELIEACKQMVAVNEFQHCYLRPLVFRGYGTFGVDPFPAPIETYVCSWIWGKYLGNEALEQGIDVCVSSWTRIAPNTLPAMAKAGANYMNSQLIKMEAKINGYVEGIALDVNGFIAEGSGENLFLVKDGKIFTPPLTSTVLQGITRDTVMKMAESFGMPVIEKTLPREMLYLADELFFTGTAAEITPIRSVDKIQIGEGKRGPITKQLQDKFFSIIEDGEDEFGWLTFVEDAAAVSNSNQPPA
jgi:branched-chain amino acid aminotransferase